MKLSLNHFRTPCKLKMIMIRMFTLTNLKKAEEKKKKGTSNQMLNKNKSTLQLKQLLLTVIKIQLF